MKIFDSTKELKGAHAFILLGREVVCPHCGNNYFEIGSALLNTPGMTFLNLDWANRTASILVCTRCSQIQYFLKQPDIKEED
ncbi:MAG: hypothetical protein ACM3P0_16005 [Acidobacteriota bacterium]